jgi:outer membrane protein assembly factor BamD
MAQSYDAMGMTKLRDDTNRVLKQNFPNSAYFSGGPQVNKPWWQIW